MLMALGVAGGSVWRFLVYQEPLPPATVSCTHPAKWHSAPSLYQAGHKGCRDKTDYSLSWRSFQTKGGDSPETQQGHPVSRTVIAGVLGEAGVEWVEGILGMRRLL